MLNIEVHIDDVGVKAAFDRAPQVMTRTLNRYLNRAATEMVRAEQDEVRANDSIFRSTLVQSFHHTTPIEFVREVRSGVNYAGYVNDGTRPGGAPPLREAKEWLRIRKNVPSDELEFRARRLRKHIAENGTKATNFNEHVVDKKESRLHALIREGVGVGIMATFGR
ncbi:MAG: hypothetical protein WAS93_03550 [Burkholderiaceae bacterium]